VSDIFLFSKKPKKRREKDKGGRTDNKNGQNHRMKKLTMIRASGTRRSKSVALLVKGFVSKEELTGFYCYLFWLASSSLRLFYSSASSLTISLMTH
jgi:hypothetical protein